MVVDKLKAKNGGLGLGTQIGYSIGSIGQGLAYNVFYIYFIFFMTDYVGVSPVVAGTISFISVIWDAITDPLVGYLSDKSKNPKGRRRPFMIKSIIPFGIVTFLLFTSWPGLNDKMQIVYFQIINILFWLFYTITDIPYMTFGGEITDNEKSRLSIRSFSTIFYYVGFLIASGLTLLLVESFEPLFKGDSLKAWSLVGGIYGIIIFISYLISIVSTKEKPRDDLYRNRENKIEESNLIQSVASALKVKPFRHMMGYILFMNIGVVIITSSIVYMATYYLGIDPEALSIIFMVYVAVIIILAPVFSKISGKFGNKKTLLMSLLIYVFGLAAFKVIPYTLSSIYFVIVFSAIGIIGWSVISYAMVYDIGEVAPLKTKSANEGIFISIYQFLYKFSGAIGTWLVGFFLTVFKYDAEAEKLSNFTLEGIRTTATLIPAIVMAIAIPFVVRYTLTDIKLEKLKRLVVQNNQGEDIDEEEYDKIL